MEFLCQTLHWRVLELGTFCFNCCTNFSRAKKPSKNFAFKNVFLLKQNIFISFCILHSCFCSKNKKKSNSLVNNLIKTIEISTFLNIQLWYLRQWFYSHCAAEICCLPHVRVAKFDVVFARNSLYSLASRNKYRKNNAPKYNRKLHSIVSIRVRDAGK